MAAIARHPVVIQITDYLTGHVAGWFGENARLAEGDPSVTERTWSYMMRYEIAVPDGADTALLVKIPREPGIVTLDGAVKAERWYRATRLEYDTLQAIATTFEGEEGFCSIRPFAYVPEWNALVMEEMPSQTLKKALLQRRMVLGGAEEWQTFETVLNRAGQWLRIFHDRLGNPESEPFDVAGARGEIERELSRLDVATRQQVDARPLRAAFDRALAGLQRAVVPIATLHGDYNCVNVLVCADGRVSALDMNESVRGSIYQDLATLLTDLSTRKAIALVYGLTGKGRRLERCSGAVLKGYFGQQPYNREVLNLACALAVVRKWTRDEEAMAGGKATVRLLKWPVRYGFRRYFGRLAYVFLNAETEDSGALSVALAPEMRVES
ncbi:MAG TPA: phosphotransferase [Ardenticatenaceae bacterium]|jgi:hypothetical protein